jgi:hypothetical protein
MAPRIAYADWTGELANGRGEARIAGETAGCPVSRALAGVEITVDVEPAGVVAV